MANVNTLCAGNRSMIFHKHAMDQEMFWCIPGEKYNNIAHRAPQHILVIFPSTYTNEYQHKWGTLSSTGNQSFSHQYHNVY